VTSAICHHSGAFKNIS